MGKVVVLAVHPDDETLGCGGTLLRHKADGDEIFWLIATNIKESDGYSADDVRKREKEIEKANEMYDFGGVDNLDLSTRKVDQYPMNELIERISKAINKIKPEIIYLPFSEDVHSDHRIIFEAAYSCTKVFRYPFIKKVLMMETISETEFAPAFNGSVFVPNCLVNISSYFEKKLEILKIYQGEISERPFPRSIENIEALAIFRGSMAGCAYAESFMLLKDIR